jgi:hypothetical protein
LFPKIKRTVKCETCEGLIWSTGRKNCKECIDAVGRTPWGNKTLKEVKGQGNANGSYAMIRQYARKSYNGVLECLICGYKIHVEIAHVRAVSSFPDDTIVNVINDPSNCSM